jgi:hypothetical protein
MPTKQHPPLGALLAFSLDIGVRNAEGGTVNGLTTHYGEKAFVARRLDAK